MSNKRSKMKLGELNIHTDYLWGNIKKYIWGYFEKNMWTQDKMSCILSINFDDNEVYFMTMLLGRLLENKIKGVEVRANDVVLELKTNKHFPTKDKHYYKRYHKLFLNVNLSMTTIPKVLVALQSAVLESTTKFNVDIQSKKVKKFLDKGMVEMI